MKTTKFALVSFVALSLLSCDKGIKTGEVIDKDYDAPSVRTTTVTRVDANGTARSVPQTIHTPENFSIQVKGISKKGKLDSQWVEVPREVYSNYKIGDKYVK